MIYLFQKFIFIRSRFIKFNFYLNSYLLLFIIFITLLNKKNVRFIPSHNHKKMNKLFPNDDGSMNSRGKKINGLIRSFNI